MKIKVDYSGQCILVPTDPVLKKLGDADGTKLRVLLFVLANPTADAAEICDTLNITERSLSTALRYWEEAGAIHVEETIGSEKQQETKLAAKSRSKKSGVSPAANKNESATKACFTYSTLQLPGQHSFPIILPNRLQTM